MRKRFVGKIALITGSSSGIGKAAAIGMAKEGAEGIVIHYSKNVDGANEAAEEIKQYGTKVLIVKADLKKTEEIKEMINSAVNEFGRIDILVNNAGMFDYGVPFLEQSEELWDAALALNIKAPYMCCKYAIPHMPENGGVIVNVASAAAVMAGGGGAAYTCTKHAVVGLTRALVFELARKGIRANTVCPGLVRTPMVEATFQRPELVEKILGPAGRPGNVDDTTNLILFIASDDASYIYGDTILVDGGLVIGERK